MSINKYKLYIESVFALAKTLSIKSEYSAVKVNEDVATRFGAAAVGAEPHQQKYYMNLCGEYHPTDTVMMIKSLDTMQSIRFSKENLTTNTVTAEAYRYGTRYYRELVAQFPENEDLILGILYPAKMAELLAAPDHSVVSYPSYLVEDNEEDLIRDINSWLRDQFDRYYVRGFRITDELFYASLLGVIASLLPGFILTQRRRACKTRQAHSYHVNAYLASHGMLDIFLDQLNQKQAMFLYKNIAYIERHGGMQDTFEWLVDNILTERGIPLTAYSMEHSTLGMPEATRPSAKLTISPVNRFGMPSESSIDALLTKEVPLLPGNPSRIDESRTTIAQRLAYSINGKLRTKVLESALVTSSDTGIVNEIDMALAMWGYTAATKRYEVYVRLKHPGTGEELAIPQRVAYSYFLYAYCQVHTRPFKVIPPVYSKEIPIWPKPSLAEVRAVVDTTYVSEGDLQALWDLHPADGTYLNRSALSAKIADITKRRNAQAYLIAAEEHFYSRGLKEGVVNRMYTPYIATTEDTGKSVEEVFSELGLPIDGLEVLEWQALYISLFEESTGYSLRSTVSKSQLQVALINLLKQLSSYSIQFVSDIVESDVEPLDLPMLRLGDSTSSAGNYFNVLIPFLRLIKEKNEINMRLNVPMADLINGFNFEISSLTAEMLNMALDINTANDDDERILKVSLANIGIGDMLPGYEDLGNYDDFNAMTPQEKAQIPDVYTYKCTPKWEVPTKVDLSELLPKPNLASFQPNQVEKRSFPAWGTLSIARKIRYFSTDNIVVVLNGFYKFDGEAEVDVFKPHFGNTIVSLFKLMGGLGSQDPLSCFKLSTGLSYTADFTPGPAEGDVVIPGFEPTHGYVSLDLMNAQHVVANISFRQLPSVALLKLVGVTRVLNMRFTQSFHSLVLQRFRLGKIAVLDMRQAPRAVVLDPFSVDRRTIDLGRFRQIRNVYELISLKPGGVHDLGRFVGYGAVILTLHKVKPVPSDPTSTKGQNGTFISGDIKLENQARTINIPNFADLLSQV